MIDPRTHVQACEDRDRLLTENAKLKADLEQMTKHAREGWDLAGTRASQWKSAQESDAESLKLYRSARDRADAALLQVRDLTQKLEEEGLRNRDLIRENAALSEGIDTLTSKLETAIRWLRRLEKQYPGCLNPDAIDAHLEGAENRVGEERCREPWEGHGEPFICGKLLPCPIHTDKPKGDAGGNPWAPNNDYPGKPIVEKQVEEPRYWNCCGKLVVPGDAAHPYGCTQKRKHENGGPPRNPPEPPERIERMNPEAGEF